MRLPLTVLIIARNEEANLPDCLHSVVGWVEQVLIVLDPRTTDRSREVAEAGGAQVVEHLFEGFAQQRNWALDSGAVTQPWVFILDADERISPELRRQIAAELTRPDPKAAYSFRSRFIFYGRWMRCWYGSRTCRLFRRGKTRYELREVHEHLIVDGETGVLSGDLVHNDFKDMDSWIEKHNRYATLEAQEILAPPTAHHLPGRLFGTALQRRRFIKSEIWNRLPFRPLWFFVYLYVVRLGVLDGKPGFYFCVMHAVFDGMTQAKVWETRWLRSHPTSNYYRALLAEDLAARPSERALYPDRIAGES